MSTAVSPRPALAPAARPPAQPTLYRRLMLAYVGVLAPAVLVLALAPITVSVPIRLGEVTALALGAVAMLALFRVLLRHALDPLERLTVLMQRVDPLAPGQRLDVDVREGEVAALARAFNDMLDRLEGERRRIARELHDEIGQILTGLVLRSETLSRRAPDDLRGDLEELREAARHGAEEVRMIARRLRPEALDELGLSSALLALCSSVSQRVGLHVVRRLESDLPLTTEQELVIYRVAQESITNVVRHADAETLEVVLRRDDRGGVELVVSDDGVGLPSGAPPSSNGLRGMRERALLVGAELAVGPARPRGTEVRLRLPLEEVA